VHRNNIPIYIQQDATLHSLCYLKTDIHVSGGTSTHHQERKQLYLQHLVFVTPLLLPAAIVEELERSSNSSTQNSVSGEGPVKQQHGSEACVAHGKYQHGSEVHVLHGPQAMLYMVNQTKENDTTKNGLKNDKAVPQLPAVDHLVKTP
jgi:hypothetical protein